METQLENSAGTITNVAQCSSARGHAVILKKLKPRYTLCNASPTNLKALNDSKIPKENRLIAPQGILHELAKQLLDDKSSGILLDSDTGEKVIIRLS